MNISDTLTNDLKEILGRLTYHTASIARRLDELGLYKVPRKLEEEQAAALHWMLSLHAKHGDTWMDEGNKILGWKRPEITPPIPKPTVKDEVL